jgi:outer membrane usher protein
VGVVGQDSRIFARDLYEQGKLTVKWGIKTSQQCSIDYTLPPRKESGKAEIGFALIDAHCLPVARAAAKPLVTAPAK